mmetsp:Transcript_20723/g.34875  ORF Transcript_20723/g.34875 Transcript_20723/m.34875 type:complete len:466 (+) Transcript_20723:1755-3152(+)|eukprot:CAMPEP_0114423356 /NCGR_PEP_ID=MMETSP0103-20121206/6105_1 /TAXON_ID=37642 ORGANISM="Paraphysomonas imperforata, Strain PA2" /NCGR_SAMPLE_ID=MMETSP0103 /ASSEMBLY_ACC=CAM_ASM_000201 /LENGTH=465 /DNA_ID=CAMNT_0001592013 /DNA_START=1765 /DNA_END=3162 /DNA_ORIENTATION=+
MWTSRLLPRSKQLGGLTLSLRLIGQGQRRSLSMSMTEKTPVTSKLWGARSAMMEREKTETSPLQATSTVLQDKSTEDSRNRIIYDFTKDATLKNLYIDASGCVSMGKLFEDLDALAGNVAFTHVDDGNPRTKQPNLVTVAVDKIQQARGDLKADDDLVLFGQIAYTGNSSMDILMKIFRARDVMEEGEDGQQQVRAGMPEVLDGDNSGAILTSVYTFVARDGRGGPAVRINKLVPQTDYEKVVCNIRRRKLQQRKRSQSESDQMAAQRNPQQMGEERDVLTSLVERGSAIIDMPALAHSNAVLMSQTTLENCFICQPQNVNMAGSVFGGFLMHRAYDIAAAAAYTFSGATPHFLECDRIQFLKSVEIGDLVRLKSRVTYSSDDPVKPTAHVEVTCQVMKPEKAVSYISNTFHFIYGFDSNITLRRVVPSNFEEARLLVKASQWSEADKFNSLEMQATGSRACLVA